MKLKFENVDVEQCLRSVMERNTKHYQSDFEFDVVHEVKTKVASIIVKKIETVCFMKQTSVIYILFNRIIVQLPTSHKFGS